MTVAYNYWNAHRAYIKHDYSKHQEWVEANGNLYALVESVRKLCEKEGINAIL